MAEVNLSSGGTIEPKESVEQILDMLKVCDEKDDFICLTKQTGKHIYVCAYRVESIEE
ncbi:MAG: hypothetical protein J6586_00100 [Snodgrassella sp.]|nr:hypothetical protein [Snodgrassella sp.]